MLDLKKIIPAIEAKKLSDSLTVLVNTVILETIIRGELLTTIDLAEFGDDECHKLVQDLVAAGYDVNYSSQDTWLTIEIPRGVDNEQV